MPRVAVVTTGEDVHVPNVDEVGIASQRPPSQRELDERRRERRRRRAFAAGAAAEAGGVVSLMAVLLSGAVPGADAALTA